MDERLEEIFSTLDVGLGGDGYLYYGRAPIWPSASDELILWSLGYDEEEIVYWFQVEAGMLTVAQLMEKTGCPSVDDYQRIRDDLLSRT